MNFRCRYCRHEADADVPITRCPNCREIVPADAVLDVEGVGRVPLVRYHARAYPL
jgi:Zn finger protein HypA/HybF involved in hydrogenase expression